jgi:hypothetical protein
LAHSTGYFYLSFSFQRGKNNSENHPLKWESCPSMYFNLLYLKAANFDSLRENGSPEIIQWIRGTLLQETRSHDMFFLSFWTTMSDRRRHIALLLYPCIHLGF